MGCAAPFHSNIFIPQHGVSAFSSFTTPSRRTNRLAAAAFRCGFWFGLPFFGSGLLRRPTEPEITNVVGDEELRHLERRDR